MHSKVIIASLVFGLSIGFAAAASTNAKATAPKEDETAYKLQKQEKGPEKEAAIIDSSILRDGDLPITRAVTTYDYVNDAYHRNNSTSSLQEHTFDAFYPYGHGHNDMCHCSLCGTNIWMTALQLDNSYSDSTVASSAKWYLFEAGYSGTFTFETTGSYDTYGELYVGNYPTARTKYNDDGGASLNFRITYSLNAGQRAFLRVRGYSWRAVSYSLSVTEHYHNYSQYSQYDGSSHKVSCQCGSYYYQAHSYTTCTFSNNAFHTMKCVCGRELQTEHTFTDYYPYGHGHNDLIYCSTCSNNVECFRLQEGVTYNHSFGVSDAIWYIFIPETSGTYTFESTGDYDTYCDLYVGNYPTTITDYNDDGGAGYNFKLSYDLEAGQMAFIRVRECDWESASYSISVVEEAPVIPPSPSTEWTVMLYMCGLNTMSQLDEIESVNIQQPNDVNIIVETDINRSTGLTDGYLHRYYLANGTFQAYGGVDGRITRTNMGSQATFQDFLYWGVEEFEADNMGLVLYNHGGGIKGVCFDGYGMSNGEDSLRASEIAAACANVFSANNIDKFEFIGYDACVMQVQDVAEMNSPYFNYQIASEEEESADMGWAYDEWVDDLFRHESIETILVEMCDGMVNAGCNCCPSWGLNLSALDLRKMGTYKTKFEQLAGAMYSVVNANRSEFENVVLSSYQFGTCASATQPGHGYGYGNFDCQKFFNNLKNSEIFSTFESLINEVEVAYDELIFYCAGNGYNGGSSPASGMSIQHLIYPEYHIYPIEETHFYNWRSLF